MNKKEIFDETFEDMMDDPNINDDWMDFRCEYLAYERNRMKELIENWCKECKVTTPVGYDKNSSNATLTIYTVFPGYLIGRGGEKVNKFKEALRQEYGKPYTVKFVEVRGAFVNVK